MISKLSDEASETARHPSTRCTKQRPKEAPRARIYKDNQSTRYDATRTKKAYARVPRTGTPDGAVHEVLLGTVCSVSSASHAARTGYQSVKSFLDL